MPYPPFTRECTLLGDIRHTEYLTPFCRVCRRKGRYALARLIEQYGADTLISRWVDRLGQTCPHWHLGPDYVSRPTPGRPCDLLVDELIRNFMQFGPQGLDRKPW